MARILVTGGAGFIGANLCRELLHRNHDVLCLDNLYTGSKDNIKSLLPNPRFEFIKHDITDTLMVEADQIYNLACPASPVHYQRNPIKTMECSTVGMTNLLRLATKLKARILQASTSEVYGDPAIHPQIESYWGNVNPIGIRSCYDEGKRAAECLCMDYRRRNETDVRIVRIFNTYGPYMAANDGRVISNFLLQALKNEPITVYGKGDQTRSFQYVSDLVEALIAMMEQEESSGPVNIGNPEEYTILEMAQKAVEVCNSKSEIVYRELPSDDPKQRRPDITLAQKLLNWSPRVSLKEGIVKTRDYFAAAIAGETA